MATITLKMKLTHFIAGISLLFTLSSCSDVVFKSPQPYKQETYSLFPPQITGTYAFYDDRGKATSDTLTVLYNRMFYNDLSGEVLFYGELNKNVELTKDGNFYFINILQEATGSGTKFYDVFVLERINSARYNVFSFDVAGDDAVLTRLKKITPAKFEIFTDSEDVRRAYLVNPTKSQLMKMIYENIAVKIGEIKKVS
jgi:dipeptidyl aminopeptidase/acylaminoacyl peptidase